MFAPMISPMVVMNGMIPVAYVCSNHVSHGRKYWHDSSIMSVPTISLMGVKKGMIPVTYVCSNHFSHGCKEWHDSSEICFLQ